MIDVLNLQRRLKLDTDVFRRYVAELASSVTEANGTTFSVAFISDRRMKELNRFFRGKDSTTDVLSFPHEPDEFEINSITSTSGGTATPPIPDKGSAYLGDIVISVEQAQKQAEENRLALEDEIKQLILHGLLHLCGYDHESDNGEMNKRELQLRRKLKI